MADTEPIKKTRDGTVYVNTSTPSWDFLNDHLTNDLLPGGHYKPTSCIPEHRVAIIVPYRDRDSNLRGFLQHMSPFLQRQRIEYKIFVIEQTPGEGFNRGLLMNVGFVESVKSDNFSCFILHDVDLLPEDIRNIYRCGPSPRQFAIARSQWNYTEAYAKYFGGVSAMSREQFQKVNGFSNVYFGWGKEDDDLYQRLVSHHMRVERNDVRIGRYKQMEHKKQQQLDARLYISTAKKRMVQDGLNSLKYEVVKHEDRNLYTWILVSCDKTELRKPWNVSKHGSSKPKLL